MTGLQAEGLTVRGKTLLSRIDPKGRAEKITAGLVPKEKTLYFCPSALYGFGLSLLLKKIHSNSAVLCVEADDDLYELSRMEMKSLIEEAKGALVLARTNGNDAAGFVCGLVQNKWGMRYFRRMEVLRLTGGWQLFPELYENISAALQKDIAISWGNAMTLIKLGRLYIKNAVKNLVQPADQTCGAAPDFADDPLLVLGAGPSLDIILDALAKRFGNQMENARDRPFRIVCADTCLPSLHDRGVTPDLAVILECQHWNLRDFRGAAGWGIPAAIDLSALPASARVLGGKNFLYMTPWTELRLFDRLQKAGLLPPPLTPLGSVGLSAVELALKLGKGPVITGGMDFSFSVDAYHARSTPGHKTRLETQNRFRTPVNAEAAFRDGVFVTVSKTGEPVRSDPSLRKYCELFNSEFGSVARLSDIYGPGLNLGTKILSVEQALELLAGKNKPHAAGNNSILERTDRLAKTAEFVMQEKNRLLRLRAILTGQMGEDGELEKILDECDYIWAHFPECAGAGGRRPDTGDLSFLKRVRTETDPFIKLWELAERR